MTVSVEASILGGLANAIPDKPARAKPSVRFNKGDAKRVIMK